VNKVGINITGETLQNDKRLFLQSLAEHSLIAQVLY